MPSLGFGVLRHGKQIRDAVIYSDIEVHTGIAYSRQITGCVPFYEEYDAMLEVGYTENVWMGLSSKERAMVMAHYRLRKYIRLHEADAVKLYGDSRPKR